MIGTNDSILCVDYYNKSILINVLVNDLYGDPFHQRQQKSPKKNPKASFSTEVEESSAETSNFITRQFTIDATSRSSSNSSLENIASSEGVYFMAINKHSSTNLNNKNSNLTIFIKHASIYMNFNLFLSFFQQI